MLTFRIVHRISDIAREAWDALAFCDVSPFVEWTWLEALEAAGCVGGDTGWTPSHFTIWRDRELVCVAPAYIKENSDGEFVYDWSWADLSHRLRVPYYPKLVFCVPFTPVTGGRVLVAPGESHREMVTQIAQHACAHAVARDLSGVHALFLSEEECAFWRNVSGFFPRAHVQYHWHNRGYRCFDDFLLTFSSKRRNQIKREAAQPEKDGTHIDTIASEDLTADLSDIYYRLYRTTTDKFAYGRPYLNAAFFAHVMQHFAPRLALVMARDKGEIVAGAFNVKKGATLYGRYWGSFIERSFLHFNVCYYKGIRDCIAEGLTTFEPGAGGEHKLVRGFDPTMTHSAHFLRDARLSAIVRAFTQREREAIAAALLQEGRLA